MSPPFSCSTGPVTIAVAVLGALCSQSRAAPEQGGSYYEQLLRENQIAPDAAGLRSYLRSLHPSEAERRRVAELIRRLGDKESFARREKAMTELLSMRNPPTAALAAAARGRDPEVRWRARRVLSVRQGEGDRLLYAALKTIRDKQPAGLAAELLRAIPLCHKPYLRRAAREALLAAARPRDAGVLRAAIKHEDLQVRAAATSALGRALGDSAAEELAVLLRDESGPVRLAAARALADLGDRRSLAALVSLLSSGQVKVRVSAVIALRGASGRFFGYAAYDTPDKRKAAVEKWSAWSAGEGRTARLKFPLKPDRGSFLGGNTLLAFGYQNKVVEYDPAGKQVWSFTIRGAWSAEKLANGNVLIASNQGNRVVEVDQGGRIVWEYSITNPLNAKPLPGGNVLIAHHRDGYALEVTRDKKVVWKHKTSGTNNTCGDVQRLENGNTLLTSYGSGVEEITPEGKSVWQYPIGRCYAIQPLPNGNILMADYLGGRVIEVTPDKKVVWEFAEQKPVDVFRLPDGNTLITSHTRFLEVTPDKKTVWTKTGCKYGAARR